MISSSTVQVRQALHEVNNEEVESFRRLDVGRRKLPHKLLDVEHVAKGGELLFVSASVLCRVWVSRYVVGKSSGVFAIRDLRQLVSKVLGLPARQVHRLEEFAGVQLQRRSRVTKKLRSIHKLEL